MGIIKVENVEEYNRLISSTDVNVVLFSANWSEQCRQIIDVMTELSTQSGTNNLKFIELPAEDLSEISIKHQIDAVPTIIFFKNNLAIDRIDGVDIAALTTKCKNLSGSVGAAAKEESLDSRLKALINKSKIMIFMKGDRVTPKCGFSRTLIEIINGTGVTYGTFDILTDDEVRQGLKTYSDWPTYPQLYVNGELIGGLDIIKELQAGNELTETLQQ